MSAIFGIYNTDGVPVQEALLHKMQKKTESYGRDGADIFMNGNIGLGCCLSKFGAHAQNDVPVYTDEAAGHMLICDALLWNRAELIEELRLDDAATTQAILMAAYQTWGADCPKHINGDFAFAVWDGKTRRLFLARDHLGVRPLYYFWDGKTFAFATDIRAVLCLPLVGKQLDEVVLYARLSGIHHIAPEASHFEQIKRLPQAHALRVSADGLSKQKYWTPGANPIRFTTEEEYKNALFHIVDDAVRRRIRGVSGKIGTELSGGLDSSVVTVLAAREMKKEGQKPCLVSWLPSFAACEQQPGDDRDWIEQVCAQEGLACAYIGGAPQADDEKENRALYRELQLMAGQGVRLILSGWGGDEGISHRASPNELLRRGYISHFLRETLRASRGNPLRFAKRLFDHTVMPLFAPFAVFWKPGKKRQLPVTRKFHQKMKALPVRDTFYFKINPAVHVESGVIQSRTELSACLDADYPVQHLYPFLDFRVVDFAMSIPGHLFYKNGRTRYVFCKAFEHILPEGLCRFPTKDSSASTLCLHEKINYAESLQKSIALADRTLFSEYIDFDGLAALADGWTPETSKAAIIAALRALRQCRDIQAQLSESADTEK